MQAHQPARKQGKEIHSRGQQSPAVRCRTPAGARVSCQKPPQEELLVLVTEGRLWQEAVDVGRLQHSGAVWAGHPHAALADGDAQVLLQAGPARAVGAGGKAGKGLGWLRKQAKGTLQQLPILAQGQGNVQLLRVPRFLHRVRWHLPCGLCLLPTGAQDARGLRHPRGLLHGGTSGQQSASGRLWRTVGRWQPQCSSHGGADTSYLGLGAGVSTISGQTISICSPHCSACEGGTCDKHGVPGRGKEFSASVRPH